MKRLIHILVGNNDRPASNEDIKQVEKQVKDAFGGDGFFATHHAVELRIIDIYDNDPIDITGIYVPKKSRKKRSKKAKK